MEVSNELALSKLLEDRILFSNERKYSDGEEEGSTVVLFVNCNDLFYWGCADAEDLPLGEVQNLLKMHFKNPRWGSDKWCCLRRGLRPQIPVIEQMKKEGAWDDELEALPAPERS